jgi:hypothetical protein
MVGKRKKGKKATFGLSVATVRKTRGGAVSVVVTPWEQPVHSICRLEPGEVVAASLGGAVCVSSSAGIGKVVDHGPVYSVVCDESVVMCSLRLEGRVEHRFLDRNSFAPSGKLELLGANTLLSRSSVLGNVAAVSHEPNQSVKIVEFATGNVVSEVQLKEPCVDSLLFRYRNQTVVAAMSAKDIVVK